MTTILLEHRTQDIPAGTTVSETLAQVARTDPAFALLCLGARTHLDEAAAGQMAVLAEQGVDWNRVTLLAERHLVWPLVYKNLSDVCADAVPAETMAWFRDRTEYTALFNGFLASEQQRILRRLEDGGVVAIPYKGIVLSKAAYGGVERRPGYDLDILIRETDFAATEAVLEAAGYGATRQLSPLRKKILLYFEHEYSYSRGGNFRFHIDLHTAIGPRRFLRAFSHDALVRRAETVEIAGARVRSLALPDLLLVLCYHGAKHRWVALKFFCDVAELLRARPEIDWDEALGLARSMRSLRMVYLGLYLAHTYLGAELPPEVLRRVEADAGVRPLAEHVMEKHQIHHAPADYRQRLHFHLAVRDTLAAKVRYGANALLLNSWLRRKLGFNEA